MLALLGVPVNAAYHLVFAFTSILTPVLGGLAAVAAIVVFTAAIRLLVTPLSFRALRGQAAQARLAPQVRKLQQRYGRQPERLQRELTALYRREGTSVFAGFGPLLAQLPVFSVLYLLFRSPNVAGGPNRLLSGDLFGVPLGNHWLTGFSTLSGQDAVFLGVFAILAVICWLSVRMARRMSAAVTPPAAVGAGGARSAGPSGRMVGNRTPLRSVSTIPDRMVRIRRVATHFTACSPTACADEQPPLGDAPAGRYHQVDRGGQRRERRDDDRNVRQHLAQEA